MWGLGVSGVGVAFREAGCEVMGYGWAARVLVDGIGKSCEATGNGLG